MPFSTHLQENACVTVERAWLRERRSDLNPPAPRSAGNPGHLFNLSEHQFLVCKEEVTQIRLANVKKAPRTASATAFKKWGIIILF